MESELHIIMEPLLEDKEEVVVTVTKDAESLNPLVLEAKETTYGELKRRVLTLCRVKDVSMVYIDTKGEAATLSNEDEFQKAWSQALLNKQLHVIVEPSLDKVAPPKPKNTTSNPYSRLATEIGEDKKRQCQKVAKSLLKEEHRRNCSENTNESEPQWFIKAMEKYTDKVIKAVVGSGSASATPTMVRSTNSLVIHQDIVCDGCEQDIIGVRYKCGNCPDYDLCEGCEQLSAFIHNEDHAFIKIKKPAKFAGVSRKGKRKPLLKRSVYAMPTVIMINKPETAPEVVLKFKHKEDKHKEDKHKEDKHKEDKHKEDKHKDSKKDKKLETSNKESEQPAMVRRSKQKLREELKHSKSHHRHHGNEGADQLPTTEQTPEPIGWEPTEDMIKKTKKQLKKDLREARRKKRMEKDPSADQDTCSSCDDEANSSSVDNTVKLVTNEATPPETTPPLPTKGHGKCLGATFVEDTSYPDDSVVYYGKAFTKGWIIENTGTKTWKKVKLVYQNGFHPDEPEIPIPNMEPGQQVEIVAEYPSVNPSDGVEIRSSWRLIHDGHTPFGDVLWLSVIAQPDPSEELLSGTFEMISYPTFSSNPDNDDATIPESLGFTHEDNKSTSPTDSAQNIGGAYTMVDPPTPVLSLTSNDSLFQINDDDIPSLDDDDDLTDNVKTTTNGGNDEDEEDDEFIVIVPDCFKLNVPIPGFKPPITEPMSPDKENPRIVTDSPVSENDKETTPTPVDPTFTPVDDGSFKEEVQVKTEEDTVLIQTQPTSSDDSPKSAQRKLKLGGFSFGRDTLEAAWTSRSTNPLRYAVGVVNTVSELVDQHVHFGTQKSSDEDYTTPEEDTELTTPPDNATTPHKTSSTTPPNFTAPAPPLLSDITQQEPDVSRFLNNKWEGHQTPASSMDQLVSMGFANRDLNTRLLEKHNNNLQAVIQELLETNGEGFL